MNRDERNQMALARKQEEQGNSSNGLAKLVLTLLETLKQLMEKQARHRITEKSLTDEEIERLGSAFIQLNAKIGEIAHIFNLTQKDLSLGLSQVGGLTDSGVGEGEQLITLADVLDRVIEKGVVVLGDLGISMADIDLINVQLRLVVSPSRSRVPQKDLSSTRQARAVKGPMKLPRPRHQLRNLAVPARRPVVSVPSQREFIAREFEVFRAPTRMPKKLKSP
jgi:Gas vesicle protein K/Gas vesicle protein